MDERDELERVLREALIESDPRAKQSVMRAFRRLPRPSRQGTFWRRPVPLYLAVGLAVILAGLGLAIGTHTSGRAAEVNQSLASDVAPSPTLTWTAAVRDQL